MMRMFTFSCPACGASGQQFSARKSLNRKLSADCAACGTQLESHVGGVKHFVFLMYAQIIALSLGFPLITGMLTGNWALAGFSIVLFVLLVWPPAMLLHARNPTIRSKKRYGSG